MIYNLLLSLILIVSVILFSVGSFDESIAIVILIIAGMSSVLLVLSVRKLLHINRFILWFIGTIGFDFIVMAVASYRVVLAGGGEANMLYFFAIPYAILVNIISLIVIAFIKKNDL